MSARRSKDRAIYYSGANAVSRAR